MPFHALALEVVSAPWPLIAGCHSLKAIYQVMALLSRVILIWLVIRQDIVPSARRYPIFLALLEP